MQKTTNQNNFIRHLQGVKRDAHHLSLQAQADLNELVSYLLSDKFHNDPTVQVNDVLARLVPARSTLVDLAHVTHPDNKGFRIHHLQD
jgi:hypothetical protein